MRRPTLAIFSIVAIALAIYLFTGSLKTPIRSASLVVKDCPNCNVVVILIDTLRADRLPFYGLAKNTAPFLNDLAAKSAVFERPFSASSWTAPAVASIFTSLLPSDHGVTMGFGATKSRMKADPTIELNRLPAEIPTMGEVMQRAGFKTVGVADNLNIGSEIGFDRGFQEFTKLLDLGANRVNEEAKRLIKKVSADGPYFAYIHYMDPHKPYERRQPWFANDCPKRHEGTRLEKNLCAYDTEIRFTDEHIAELFREFGWLENSIVVVTADHGEEFGDHGGTGHGKTLYTEMIYVPLMVYHPKRTARRIPAKVHTIDILPTLAALAGQPAEPHWRGVSLVPFVDGTAIPATLSDRSLISERFGHTIRTLPPKRSIIENDRHYIQTEARDALPMKKELYDLEHDFAEKQNLSAAEDRVVADLHAQLERLSKFPEKSSKDTMSIPANEEILEQLRSLGYIN